MSFKVGDRVVCIDDSGMKASHCLGESSGLKEGNIYEIARITHNGLGCLLKTILGEFICSRFRKLDYDFVEEVIKQVQPEKVEL